MSLSAILAAAAEAANVPGVKQAHYPPPERLAEWPCVVVEATGGRNNLPASFEGELRARTHRFAVNVFAAKDYHPEHYGRAVALFEAVAAALDADYTLGGTVTYCGWVEYTVGGIQYAGGSHTGAVITVECEEK